LPFGHNTVWVSDTSARDHAQSKSHASRTQKPSSLCAHPVHTLLSDFQHHRDAAIKCRQTNYRAVNACPLRKLTEKKRLPCSFRQQQSTIAEEIPPNHGLAADRSMSQINLSPVYPLIKNHRHDEVHNNCTRMEFSYPLAL
jgi:hypothetical protein